MVLPHGSVGKGSKLTWNLEGEIQACKHNSQEDPPTASTSHEDEGTRRFLQPTRKQDVAVADLPVCACEAAEGADEREEDDDEGDVGAQTADEVDEAHQAHSQEEEAEGAVEGDGLEAGSWVRGIGGVGAPGVVEGLQSAGEAHPEGAEGTEDDEGECVTNDPLENVLG
jgi:hypothetical protein